MDPIYLAITGLAMFASNFVGQRLRQRFQQYSALSINMTGKEVAEKMLHDYGIHDVEVISVRGQLTDHYNPKNRTVNLSEVVYNEANVSAAAVAAHEVGHAIQHATQYSFLQLRSNLVQIVGPSSKLLNFLLPIGLMMAFSGITIVLFIAIILFAMTTLFSVVTLPVEYDASNRALAWLNEAGIMAAPKHEKAKDALKWAARTYLVAALASLGQLLYFVMLYNRASNR